MTRYFQILFLTENASLIEVKRAYRKLAKEYHPDKNNGSKEATKKFRTLQDAYEKVVEYISQKENNKQAKQNSNFQSEKTDYNNNRKERKQNHSYSYKTYHTYSKKSNTYTQTQRPKFEKPNRTNTIARTYGIGEIINIGYFEYIVIKADYSKSIGKTEANGIFLIIELKVINTNNIRQTLHNYMFRILNPSNDFFEFSSQGLSALHLNNIKHIDFFGKELNPKISVTVTLIFEVPQKDSYHLNLCGGEYEWDTNNICHCKETKIVRVT